MRYLVIFPFMLLAGAANAQLNKCVGPSGKVEYQQAPCADPRQAAGMAGGTVSGVDAMSRKDVGRAQALERAERAQEQRNVRAQQAAGQRRGTIPTDEEIRNLEISANSKTIGQKEREFLQSEVRRAKAAQREGGTYTKEDWDEIRRGQSSQSRLSAHERDAARRETEAVHGSSASANQRRILQAEQDREALKEAAREAAAQSGGTVIIDGRVCQRHGNFVNC